jgi:hypothetical protein
MFRDLIKLTFLCPQIFTRISFSNKHQKCRVPTKNQTNFHFQKISVFQKIQTFIQKTLTFFKKSLFFNNFSNNIKKTSQIQTS